MRHLTAPAALLLACAMMLSAPAQARPLDAATVGNGVDRAVADARDTCKRSLRSLECGVAQQKLLRVVTNHARQSPATLRQSADVTGFQLTALIASVD